MTWRSSRRFLVGLLLLFCSSLVFSQAPDYDGPALPEGWYPIHDQELGQISLELTMLEQDLENSIAQLTIAETRLGEAEKTSTLLQSTVGRLETSLIESDRETRIWRRMTLIVGSVGLVGWALHFLAP